MSILATVGSLLAGGWWLNKKGKTPREFAHPRQQIHPEEEPSGKHIYHSERYYDAWTNEWNRASKAHLKAQDTVNENVVPGWFNSLGSRSETSPELKSYIEKRGSRLKFFDESQNKKTFINEGGNEVNIDESPMFSPIANVDLSDLRRTGTNQQFLGADAVETREGFKSELAGDINQPTQEQIEKFSVVNRKTDSRCIQPSKMEHFANFTVSGPRNSNNPNYHNNLVPFFGSKITQNTDPEAHQHLLERFTGQTNDVAELRAQPKREIPSLFDRTPGQTYIYGAPADNAHQRDRYVTSNFKRNVTPFEQIRVGPGINPNGKGADKYGWKPQDGFHPKWRCPQKNVDELRVNPKNVYGGRLLPGKEQVTNRGFCGDVFKRRPDTFYINDQRRWFTTTGAYTGAKVRENFVAYKQNREDTNVAYTGSASANKDNLGGYTGVYLEGTSGGCGGLKGNAYWDEASGKFYDPDTNKYYEADDPEFIATTGKGAGSEDCDTLLNQFGLTGDVDPEINLPDGTRSLALPDGKACGLMSQVKHTDRQQLAHTPFRNLHNEDQNKQQTRPYDKLKPTIKQTNLICGYKGAAGTQENAKGKKYLYDLAKPTIYQTTLVCGYQGIVGQVSENGRVKKYFDQPAKPTIKESTLVQGRQGIVGQVAENGRVKKYFDQPAKPTTKQTNLVQGRQGIVGSVANNGRVKKYLDDPIRATTKQTTLVCGYKGQANNSSNLKSRKYLYDRPKATNKQSTLVCGYKGQAGNGQNLKSRKYLYDKARATVKETALACGYKGQAGNRENLKSRKYLYDKLRPTVKQSTLVCDYKGGVQNSENVRPQSYEAIYNATTNNNTEQLVVDGARTYGPNKATNITVGACDINMQMKQKTGYDKTKYGLIGTKLYTATPALQNSHGNAQTRNQRDLEGVRQPESYLTDAFEKNPYTQSLNSATPLTTPFRRDETPSNNSEACKR